MKKFTLALCAFLFISTSANAQFDFDKLFGGANLGWASPQGDFKTYAQGGIAYNGFVGYKLKDKISVGLQYGSAILAGSDSSGSTGLFGINAFGLTNFHLKGWYSPLEGDFKPFGSLALGLAQVEEPSVTIGNEEIPGKMSTGFGAEAQLGFNIKNVTVSYAYVLGGRGPKDGVWNPLVSDLPMNYTRISVGYMYNF